MKYIVLVREVHISHREVEANNEEEAKSKVYHGQPATEETYLEYSHTLDRWYWTVEEAEDSSANEEAAAKKELAVLEAALDASGGRGVELADRIDELRKELGEEIT